MTCGTNWTTEILTILQFLELACNFFEPDRDLPRPTFDTSARPARPDGHVGRDRDTAGQRQTRRRTTRQSVEVQISDSNGNICYFGMIILPIFRDSGYCYSYWLSFLLRSNIHQKSFASSVPLDDGNALPPIALYQLPIMLGRPS